MDDIKLVGKKQNIDLMWKIPMKEVNFGEPTSFPDHVDLGRTQRECLEKSYQIPKNRMRIFLLGPVTWKVTRRNALKDISNLQIKRLNNIQSRNVIHG